MDESIKIRVRELAALEREKRKKLNERKSVKTVKKTKAGKKFESKEIDGFARIRENEENFATQLKTGKKTKAGRRTELSSQEKNDLLICENEENFASRLPKNDKKWKIKGKSEKIGNAQREKKTDRRGEEKKTMFGLPKRGFTAAQNTIFQKNENVKLEKKKAFQEEALKHWKQRLPSQQNEKQKETLADWPVLKPKSGSPLLQMASRAAKFLKGCHATISKSGANKKEGSTVGHAADKKNIKSGTTYADDAISKNGANKKEGLNISQAAKLNSANALQKDIVVQPSKLLQSRLLQSSVSKTATSSSFTTEDMRKNACEQSIFLSAADKEKLSQNQCATILTGADALRNDSETTAQMMAYGQNDFSDDSDRSKSLFAADEDSEREEPPVSTNSSGFYGPISNRMKAIENPDQFDNFCDYGEEKRFTKNNKRSIILSYLSSRNRPNCLIQYSTEDAQQNPIDHSSKARVHMSLGEVYGYRFNSVYLRNDGVLVAYLYCQNRDKEVKCRGTETFWLRNPADKIAIDYSADLKYYKLKESAYPRFFQIFGLDPPDLRLRGESRHEQNVTHTCRPCTTQDIGNSAFENEVHTNSINDHRSRLDITWFRACEKNISMWYPGWQPQTDHKKLSRKAKKKQRTQRGLLSSVAEQLLKDRYDTEDENFKIVPAMQRYLVKNNNIDDYEKFCLYEDNHCAIVGSKVFLRMLPRNTTVVRILIDGTWTSAGPFYQHLTIKMALDDEEGERVEHVLSIFLLGKKKENYRHVFAAMFYVIDQYYDNSIKTIACHTDCEIAINQGLAAAAENLGIQIICTFCSVHIIRCIFRGLKDALKFRSTPACVRLTCSIINSCQFIRFDLVTDILSIYYSLIRSKEETGKRLANFIKKFHSRILGTIWSEFFSLHDLVEASFVHPDTINFTTNPNESLHTSLNEIFRQRFKKRRPKSSNDHFEVVHESFQRRLDDFINGLDDNRYTSTERELHNKTMTRKFSDFSAKYENKKRTFDERVNMFVDFLEIVKTQYEGKVAQYKLSKSMRLRLDQANLRKLLNQHHPDLPANNIDYDGNALTKAMKEAGKLKNKKKGVFDGYVTDEEEKEDESEKEIVPEDQMLSEMLNAFDWSDSSSDDDEEFLKKKSKSSGNHVETESSDYVTTASTVLTDEAKSAIEEYNDLYNFHYPKKDMAPAPADDLELHVASLSSGTTSSPEKDKNAGVSFNRNKRKNLSIRQGAPSVRTKHVPSKKKTGSSSAVSNKIPAVESAVTNTLPSPSESAEDSKQAFRRNKRANASVRKDAPAVRTEHVKPKRYRDQAHARDMFVSKIKEFDSRGDEVVRAKNFVQDAIDGRTYNKNKKVSFASKAKYQLAEEAEARKEKKADKAAAKKVKEYLAAESKKKKKGKNPRRKAAKSFIESATDDETSDEDFQSGATQSVQSFGTRKLRSTRNKR
ncbi:unnamed protein product [Oikopleura dioica]|uniref:Uncharacterized protein n=1 Tax=Oikopleura dioica TaxID=34765 RepID=E4YHH9_OIKDI|nr:unnamed protein product [Oikopleura dioica]